MWLALLALSPKPADPVLSFGAPDAFTFASDLQPTIDGGVVVVGRTQGSLAAPAQGPGSGDAYMVRLDAQGRTLWARQWGARGLEEAPAVLADEAGFWTVVQHNGAEGLGELGLGAYSSAILHLDHQGRVDQRFAVPGLVEDIAMTPGGALVVCGAQVHAPSGTTDWMLAQYSQSGERQWSHVPRAGGSDEHCRAVHADQRGVVATGRAMGSVMQARSQRLQGLRSDHDVAGGLMTTSLEPEGQVRWTRVISGQLHGWGQEVVVDGDGQAWVAGSFEHVGASPNRTQAALLRFSPQGEPALVHAVEMEASERTRDDLALAHGRLHWAVGLPYKAPEGLPQAEMVLTEVGPEGVGPWEAVDSLRRGARIAATDSGLALLGLTCEATPFHSPSAWQGCDPAVRALRSE